MTPEEIKTLIRKRRLRTWEVAAEIGISPQAFYRYWLGNPKKEQRILSAISSILTREEER